MKVKLIKAYDLNGIIKPEGSLLEVTTSLANKLMNDGYVTDSKRKKIKVETTNII